MSDNWFGDLFIKDNDESDDDLENVVDGKARIIELNKLRLQDSVDEFDEEVQKKPSIKDKLFSYIPNLGSYTDFMSGFSDTFGFQEEVYEVNIKEYNKCDDNDIPPNSKIVGIFDNQCVWLNDNNEINTTGYNEDTLLDENKNTTNTNEGNAENEFSNEVRELENVIGKIELDNMTGQTKKSVITALTNIKNFNRGQKKDEKGNDEWEKAVRSLIINTIILPINFYYKDKYEDKYEDKYIFNKLNKLFKKNDYYTVIYDKLENMKNGNIILNTIKDYFINNSKDIVEYITKYGNEPE